MNSLETITSLKLPKIPEFNMDYFQSEIRSHFFLEFFFQESRFLVSPEQKILTTGPCSEKELNHATMVVESKSTQINAIRNYVLYQLALYSSLLESNSYYISLNAHTVICRFVSIPDHPEDFELKLYTIERRDLPKNYKDKIYIGRDFISLTRIDREHFGLKHIRNSLKDQLVKLQDRFNIKIVKAEDKKVIQTEYVNEILELFSDFCDQADHIIESLPVSINSSDLEKGLLTKTNRQFRELKHILIEMEDTVRDMENFMFDQVISHAVRYATKFKKDLTNYINYITIKINGRISDAVNGTHI